MRDAAGVVLTLSIAQSRLAFIRWRRLCCALTLVGVLRSAAGAQSPVAADTGVAVLTPASLRAVLDSLRAKRLQSRSLSERGAFHYLLMQRTQTGSVEIHQNWTDVFVVTDGAAELRYAGRASGGQAQSPGEYRGGSMEGGRVAVLHAGDVIVIPAGTPHQIVLTATQQVGYLAFKLRTAPIPPPAHP